MELEIMAVTGDEYRSTIEAANTYLVPMLRVNGIRFLQVARGGQATHNGYDVLADSVSPSELVPRGAWHLGEEMEQALTVPQIVSGRRLCSYRAKGEVLDSAIADEITAGRVASDFRHVIAFAAEEKWRAKRDSSYTTNARHPWYPLIEKRRDRTWCAGYLKRVLKGFVYPRSCCVICCFQAPRAGRSALAARWHAEPEAGVYALHVERRALSINRRMRLFGSLSAAEFVRSRGIDAVIELADAQLAEATTWTVVETRRVYRPASIKDPTTGKSQRGRDGRTVKDPTRKGDTWRSIRPHVVTDTREDGLAALTQLAHVHDTLVWTEADQVPRVDVRVLPNRPREWPITTHEYALMPGVIDAKEHAGFDREWRAARSREVVRGGGATPLPLAM
ncbi:hypothetical protein [Actinophytocola oryzae]|uniref:Uncharacterized protein n=1 Tax=Actinophytocola oryzae TaxID=502181 RepID=A0A4R7V4X3_9PSEU|nr:hypothetical protein [Actinophytocola oryzae]TDV43707.1 hypothetical protein CLV71_115170 [Actinophytocola oryzae]